MNTPPAPRPRQRRYSVRRQARLDAETHATLAVLANTFHRKRAAILRFVMGWGLTQTREWTIDPSIPDRPHLMHMLVNPELVQQVQEAADAHGTSVAAWLRHAVRQVTRDDFPPSWRAEETTVRSHDSGYYDRRFQLRLDPATQRELERLMQTFGRSAADVIRQLIAQATSEDFPSSWEMTAHELRTRKAQPSHDGFSARDTHSGGI
jgi:predicted transcriptional regulator